MTRLPCLAIAWILAFLVPTKPLSADDAPASPDDSVAALVTRCSAERIWYYSDSKFFRPKEMERSLLFAQFKASGPLPQVPRLAFLPPAGRNDPAGLTFEAAPEGVRVYCSTETSSNTFVFQKMVLAGKNVCISSQGGQLVVTGPHLHARCDRLSMAESNSPAVLAGTVHLKYKSGKKDTDLVTQQITVDLETGHMELAEEPFGKRLIRGILDHD